MHEPSDYWTDLASQLVDWGYDVRLIGALAAQLYRTTPRSTTDVDFLADRVDGLDDRFDQLGYDCHVAADESGRPYAVFARGHGRRVDILAAETEYQRRAMDRSDGLVIAVEDVLIHKLIAWRAADRDDVIDILRGRPELDRGYLDHWIDQWEVGDRWAEAVQAAS